MVGSEVTTFYSQTSAALVTRRCRLQAVVLTYESGATGHVVLYDNATEASGKVLIRVDETSQGMDEVYIPGDGILAKKGVYASIPANTTITVMVE
tara:strand:+ start:461 stop:745 length:285 start_codon:yes stop_codon:yes gene_type:complete